MKSFATVRPGDVFFEDRNGIGTNYEIAESHISGVWAKARENEDKSDIRDTILSMDDLKRLTGSSYVEFVQEYRVEFIERKDAGEHFNFGYSGQWADETVEASSEEEAKELVKQHLVDGGVDPDYIDDDMLFRTM